MSKIEFKKHRVFRETEAVIFYDISIKESNAQDLVIHAGKAVSPPNTLIGAKQFYIHYHQIDNNRVLQGSRVFELINPKWEDPYHIVHLNRHSGALTIPKGTFHRSWSEKEGSIVINQAIRDPEFDENTEFIPVSVSDTKELFNIINYEKPIIHGIKE
jgi:hypothetical protein